MVLAIWWPSSRDRDQRDQHLGVDPRGDRDADQEQLDADQREHPGDERHGERRAVEAHGRQQTIGHGSRYYAAPTGRGPIAPWPSPGEAVAPGGRSPRSRGTSGRAWLVPSRGAASGGDPRGAAGGSRDHNRPETHEPTHIPYMTPQRRSLFARGARRTRRPRTIAPGGALRIRLGSECAA